MTGWPSSETATQPASLQLAHLGQRLALEALGDGADRVDPHRADLARAARRSAR